MEGNQMDYKTLFYATLVAFIIVLVATFLMYLTVVSRVALLR